MKSFSQILESKKEPKKVTSTILFTDIIGSSNLWSDHGDKMFKALIKHGDFIDKEMDNHDGFVVKTIGDAFMISFEGKDSLLDAIELAFNLSKKMNIKVAGKDDIKLRIGIAYGELRKYEDKIQGNKVYDYFGNVVNTASRMESKVSPKGGFAFTMIDDISADEEQKIMDFLEDKCNLEIIDYELDCRFDKNEKIKRSARLLTDIQRSKCENIKELKGVKPLRAFKCKL